MDYVGDNYLADCFVTLSRNTLLKLDIVSFSVIQGTPYSSAALLDPHKVST